MDGHASFGMAMAGGLPGQAKARARTAKISALFWRLFRTPAPMVRRRGAVEAKNYHLPSSVSKKLRLARRLSTSWRLSAPALSYSHT